MVLTEAGTGKSYVDINGATAGGIVEANVGGGQLKAATIPLKVTVNYTGNAANGTEVAALWANKIAATPKIRVTISCSTASMHGTAIAGAPDTSDIRGVTDATAATNGNLYADVTASSWSFSAGEDPVNFTTGEQTVGTVYVAITGNADDVYDADNYPIYSLTATPSQVA